MIYVSGSGAARKISDVYVSPDGSAKKVSAVYIGDATGQSRLVFRAAAPEPPPPPSAFQVLIRNLSAYEVVIRPSSDTDGTVIRLAAGEGGTATTVEPMPVSGGYQLRLGKMVVSSRSAPVDKLELLLKNGEIQSDVSREAREIFNRDQFGVYTIGGNVAEVIIS